MIRIRASKRTRTLKSRWYKGSSKFSDYSEQLAALAVSLVFFVNELYTRICVMYNVKEQNFHGIV